MRDISLELSNHPEQIKLFLQNSSRARVLAGGTDLLPLLKDDIEAADTLVSILGASELQGISSDADGLTIGALTTLDEIAGHPLVKASYGALAQACRLAASPQLRNMGTIGGNLLQQTRCWYYRGPALCWLKGGETCYARSGENELHSIFLTGQSPCVSAHPSDPAAALLALDAQVHYIDGSGPHQMPLSDLYRLPNELDRDFWTLPKDALVTAVRLGVPSSGSKSVYVKAMSRATWSFALAGVALRTGDAARVALSGVAPIPYRASEAEDYLGGRGDGDIDADRLAELIVVGARPLSQNGYKVDLLQGIVRQALRELAEA